MNFSWTISKTDVRVVSELVARMRRHPVVADRESRNLTLSKLSVDRARFWREMLYARVTSRQRSGPKSAASRLRFEEPFPVEYNEVVRAPRQTGKLILRVLKQRGFRDYEVIARQMQENFDHLEAGGWNRLLAGCDMLLNKPSPGIERQVAQKWRRN